MRLATLIGLMGLSSSAFAQQVVTGVTYDVDSHDDVRIEVLGVSPLQAPRIRTTRGQIRAWFPNIDNNPRVSTPGDGTVIDALQLRPGVEDTAVLTVELGSRVRLASDAIRYEATARGGVLHVARSALPAVRIMASVTPVAQVAEAESAAESAEAEAAPEAEAALEAADADANADTNANADADADAEGVAEPVDEDAAGTPLFADRGRSDDASTGGTEGRSMGALLLISLLLGALYMLIKTVQKKRKIVLDDDIAVVASKRLGPRYQLMVVRALGQDHLLSIHRGQTQLLSSMSSPTAEEAAALEQSGLSILDRIQGKVEDTVRLSGSSHASPSEPIADEDRFGAKLLNLEAIRRRMQSSEPSQSDAVAGLMRLRARAAK